MTRTCFASPAWMYAWAVAKPYTNPLHAAMTSNAVAFVLPIASFTSAAVDGIQ